MGTYIQLEWQYLQMSVPGAGTIMDPIYDAIREAFFPAIFGEEEVSADVIKILGYSVKRDVT